ncbi:MAG: CPBP family intramembrane glutamic endopeptidase [Vicinamibacterales bacterium]
MTNDGLDTRDVPTDDPTTPVERGPDAGTGRRGPSRLQAVGEAVLCSSYPTQIVAATALALLGVRAGTDSGALDPTFVIAVSTLDALLVLGLMVYFLARRGESLRDLWVGTRPVWRESLLGATLVVPVTLGVALIVLGARALAPTLHNVPVNPMTALMADPRLAALFALVVVVAGGIREEMQRAFQLHRLSPGVMTPAAALVITSVTFGLGHLVQGRDVAVATGALGFLWGAMWLRRRSIVAAAVCHALFNLGQVAAGWAASHATTP